ncbi:MAG TPA: HD domain-containing protein [Ktedonobacterales bacterium]
MSADERDDARASETGAPARVPARPDAVYGSVRVAAWAADLLATAPFQRLAGVSLSDVPGELLTGRPFPSRLDHVIGVYHLVRLARPRDRALQAAALAHDLGHGPFSHLSEPLMREWLGCDHEQRAARKLAEARARLSPAALRRLAWLDWDEVAALVVGGGTGGRGALLNGPLDYDNIEYVARFLLAADLGAPGYDPVALARALRLAPAAPDGRDSDGPAHGAGGSRGTKVPAHGTMGNGPEGPAHGGGDTDGRPPDAPTDPAWVPVVPTVLLPAGAAEGVAWQGARARVYGYLHGQHANLAPHAMLRKAIELAWLSHELAETFLDLTDAQALAALAGCADRGAATLAQRVGAGSARYHTCVWEAPANAARLPASPLVDWRPRLELERSLAAEAGLAPHEVILEVLTSRARRALPPVAGRAPVPARPALAPAEPPVIHLFVSAEAPRDYRHRLRAATERRLRELGVLRGDARTAG